jgi:flagellum-specific peptidoglycan hydrolase FlgJ
MKEILQLIKLKIRLWATAQKRKFSNFVFQNKLKLGGLLLIFVLAKKNDFNFSLPKNSFNGFSKNENIDEASLIDSDAIIDFVKGKKSETKRPKAQTVSQTSNKSWKDDASVGNNYDNVSFWGGRNDNVEKRSKKRDIQDAYVKRFVKIAQTETEKFGIPTSIILAQGILESNAGGSRLATSNNNHFGIKCFSRVCKKGHCSNFTDDSHKDFFKVYQSPWQSFRDHSLLLKRFHYRKLFNLDKKDYRNWAIGLQKLGYATDQHYAESLIRTIEDLDLAKLD